MPDQPTEPPQPESTSSDSVELLQRILQRLQCMEGGLSQHEEWLRRFEHEHHPEAAPSAPMIPSAAAASGSLQQPCGEDDLRRLVASLTLERDRANKQLAEARQQPGRHQQELAALRKQLRDLEGIAAKNRWPRLARVAVVLLLVAGLASAGLTNWLYERGRASSVQSAGATIVLPGADAQAVQRCAALVARYNDIMTTPDPALGRIEIRAVNASGPSALRRVDEVTKAILAALSPPAVNTAYPPTSQPDGRRLAARIAESQRQLGAMSRPADTATANTDELATQYTALRAERRKISDALADLTRRIEARPAVPPLADVPSDQIAKAEAANPQLQSELEALKQREDQLIGRLRMSLDAAAVQVGSLRQALATADADMEKLLEEETPPEVATQLNVIRDSLKVWGGAVAELETQWQTQRNVLQTPGTIDALAVQATLQKAAQTFVAEATGASIKRTKAIEAIGQGQDQTTKRLVLRNALLKQFSPVTAAQESVMAAARSAILADNVELIATVQPLDALRWQVQQHRTQILANLRQDTTGRLQRDHDTRLSQTRQEQAALSQRAAETDAALLRLSERAVQTTADLAERAGSLKVRASLQERQIQDLQQLVGMHEQRARQFASLAGPPGPICTPARLLAGPADSPPLTTALLFGAMPFVGTGVLLLIIALVKASRRSRNTIEQYARSLKEMARRDDAGAPAN